MDRDRRGNQTRSVGASWSARRVLRRNVHAQPSIATCFPRPGDDGRHKAYLHAVKSAFAVDADYAMLVKLYGEPVGSLQERR